jgi:1,4-dihydroxy-2-naphthoate octaprenyltransferase
MNKFTKYAIILRAYSLPASVIPVIIGSYLAYQMDKFNPIIFGLTLLAAIMLHTGSNLINTFFDYKNGVDKEDADDIGIVKNLIPDLKAKKLAISLILLSSFIGLGMVFFLNIPEFLLIALPGVLLSWFYTAGFSYKYKAMGEIGIFLAFGPLITIGTTYLQIQQFSWDAFWVSIPLGLLIVDILLANNIRDAKTDAESNIITLTHILGEKGSKVLYFTIILFAYLIAIYHTNSISSLLFLLSIPVALKLIQTANKREYTILVRSTAQFVTAFGINFILVLGIKSLI